MDDQDNYTIMMLMCICILFYCMYVKFYGYDRKNSDFVSNSFAGGTAGKINKNKKDNYQSEAYPIYKSSDDNQPSLEEMLKKQRILLQRSVSYASN